MTGQAQGKWLVLPNANGYFNGGMACTYDNVHQLGIRFGGDDYNLTQTNDLYTWNGNSWEFIWSGGPSPRVNSFMAFDNSRRTAVLFGGWVRPDNYYGDTWVWNGIGWRQFSPVRRPPARANQAMGYDSVRNRVVLFGGSLYQTFYGDTWEWDGAAKTWTLRSTTGPSPRMFARMAFDEARGVMVLFGGQFKYQPPQPGLQYFGDTWEWNGVLWRRVATSGPSPRSWHNMAYDPTRKRVILFGGSGDGRTYSLNDLWEWDGRSWTNITDYGPTNPPSRIGSCLFFDSITKKLTLFGGYDHWPGFHTYRDTWRYTAPITVRAPNGGETWPVGSTQVISCPLHTS